MFPMFVYRGIFITWRIQWRISWKGQICDSIWSLFFRFLVVASEHFGNLLERNQTCNVEFTRFVSANMIGIIWKKRILPVLHPCRRSTETCIIQDVESQSSTVLSGVYKIGKVFSWGNFDFNCAQKFTTPRPNKRPFKICDICSHQPLGSLPTALVPFKINTYPCH
jgi:hypothetical protein